MPVPVLDGHRQDGVASILGTLERVAFDGGAMIGTVRISARHELLMDDIESGVIRSVSIGYTVQNYDDRPGPTGQKTRTATRWTLAEASFVSVPADPQATTRSHTMTTETTTAAPPVTTTQAPPVATVTRAEPNAEIRALATTLGLPGDFANGLIDREATMDQARAEAIAQVQTRATTTAPRVTLRDARAKGIQRARLGDEEITYRADAEMVAAISDLESRLAAAQGQTVRTFRFTTSKGL